MTLRVWTEYAFDVASVYMSSRIIKSVADLPKVCEHINLPVQSGDDEVLRRMRRPYSTAEYRDIISQIRDTIPDVTVSTDIIVGFPGETEEQYENTLRLVEDLRFDKCTVRRIPPGPVPSQHGLWMTTLRRMKSSGA